MATFNQGPLIEGVVSPVGSTIRKDRGGGRASTATDRATSVLGNYEQSISQIANMTPTAISLAAGVPVGSVLANQVAQTPPTLSVGTTPLGTFNSLSDAQIIAQREQNLRDFQNGVIGGVGGDGPANPSGGGGAGNGTNGLETAVNNPGLGDVSRQAIEAQINALTAQYGLDIAQIAALGGEIGRQARFLMDQIAIDQSRSQEQLIGQLVGRGIFRSGIAARDIGRQAQDFATKRGEVNLNMGQRLRQLAERAGAANVALGRGKADVIGEIDKGNLGAELRQQLLGELNSLTPEDIQRALDQAYTGAPSAVTGLIKRTQGAAGQQVEDDYLQKFFASALPNTTQGSRPRV